MSSVPLGDDQMPDDHESMKQEKNAMLKPLKRRDSKQASEKKNAFTILRVKHISLQGQIAPQLQAQEQSTRKT